MSNGVDAAYRGFLIRFTPLTGLWWIEKGGQRIAWVADRNQAIGTIDGLCD